MNTVFARALLALTLVALPTSALASTKSEAKADKAKREAKAEPKPAHAHSALAKKELPGKKAKHRAHKDKGGKRVTSAPSSIKAP